MGWKTPPPPPVLIGLTEKGDGTKCKPFIVFAGAKRESKSLYKRRCSVASSANGWINEELTLHWCDEVPGGGGSYMVKW